MSNSQIPYTFVPGTKAMASEINANFLALANIVDEGKQFTTDSIDAFNTEMEARLDETLGNVLTTNMSNSTCLANTVTEVPHRLKYTLVNGVLTIKAGSVLIVPYGNTDLSTTYTVGSTFINSDLKVKDTQYSEGKFFVWVELLSDRTFSDLGGSTNKYLVIDVNTSTFGIADIESGNASAATSCLYYNTETNYVKWLNTTSCFTFPLLKIDYSSSSVAIKEIYDGMGCAGATVWIDKGTKCLIPNGRNSNGNLNNVNYTFSTLRTVSMVNNYVKIVCICQDGTIMQGITFDPVKSISDRQAVNSVCGYYAYVENENKVYTEYYTEPTPLALLAEVDVVNGVIASFRPRLATNLVSTDYLHSMLNSVFTKSGFGFSTYYFGWTANYVSFGNGLKVQWGTIATDSGTITFPCAFASTSYFASCTNIVASGYNSGVRNLIKTRTTTNMTVAMGWSSSSSSEFWLNGSTWFAVGY